jgi:hypothetical protein
MTDVHLSDLLNQLCRDTAKTAQKMLRNLSKRASLARGTSKIVTQPVAATQVDRVGNSVNVAMMSMLSAVRHQPSAFGFIFLCVPWRTLNLGGGPLKADREGAKNARNLENHNWKIFAKRKMLRISNAKNLNLIAVASLCFLPPRDVFSEQ